MRKLKCILTIVILSLFFVLNIKDVNASLFNNVIIENEFGYDNTNEEYITSPFTLYNYTYYGSESTNVTLNKEIYPSIKAIKLVNNSFVEYSSIDDDINDIDIRLNVAAKDNDKTDIITKAKLYVNDVFIEERSVGTVGNFSSFNNIKNALTGEILEFNVSNETFIKRIKIVFETNSTCLYFTKCSLSYDILKKGAELFEEQETKASLKLQSNYINENEVNKAFYNGESDNIINNSFSSSLVNLESVYTVTGEKRGANSYPTCKSATKDIRIYRILSGNDASYIKIARNDSEKILKISVSFTSDYDKGLEVYDDNNNQVLLQEGEYLFEEGTSFVVLKNSSTLKAIAISNIIITTTKTVLKNVESIPSLRFACFLTKELYDSFVSLGDVEFGIIASKKDKLEGELNYDNATVKRAIDPVRVNEIGAQSMSLDGNYYQFSIVFYNFTLDMYDDEIVARSYLKTNDKIYLAKCSTYSIASISSEYIKLNEEEENEVIKAHLKEIEYLSSFLDESPKVYVYYIDLEGNPGDASLIKYGDIDIMVDSGKGDSKSNSNITSFLNEHVSDGIIEYAIATHEDDDHYGGFLNVFDNFDCEKMIKYATCAKTSDDDFEEGAFLEMGENVTLITEFLNGENVKRLFLSEDVYLEFYDTTYLEDNSHVNWSSIVFTLYAYETKIIFSGDAEEKQEEVYSVLAGDVDIYSMGHHGSKNATSNSLLMNSTPEVVIAQVGDYLGNSYNHPTIEAINRVYAVDENILIYSPAGGYNSKETASVDRNGTLTVEIFENRYNITANLSDLIEMRDTVYYQNNSD